MKKQLSHWRCAMCGRLCIEGTPHFCGSTYEALECALREALRENQRLTRKVARMEKRTRTTRRGMKW
jgi:hypothetical protein